MGQAIDNAPPSGSAISSAAVVPSLPSSSSSISSVCTRQRMRHRRTDGGTAATSASSYYYSAVGRPDRAIASAGTGITMSSSPRRRAKDARRKDGAPPDCRPSTGR